MKLAWQKQESSNRLEEIAQALVGFGVDEKLATRIAPWLKTRLTEATHQDSISVLEGVAIALEYRSEGWGGNRPSDRNPLDELESMVGAFSSEVLKLDEVLAVLNVYVQRMRISQYEKGERQLN